MKEQKIKDLTEKVGATRAPKFWGLFVERLCEGIEPEAGDTFKREDIERAFANNPTARDALIAIFCGEQKEAPKPTTLKEKRRETLGTDVLLVEHLKGSAPAWITAELVERSKGQGCLFTKDGGGIYEIESIQWIEWLRAGAPMAEGREIEGKFRRPVRIGQEKPLATFPRDPFPSNARGAAPLKMPGFVSGCGASFESADKPGTLGVTSEALSFLILVSTLEVPSVREQREACETAKKGIEELRAAFPLAKQAWDEGRRPESTVPAVPFADPPATTTAPRGGDVARPSGWTPTLCFLGARGDNRELWGRLKGHLSAAQDAGLFRMVSDDDVPPGGEAKKLIAGYTAASDAVLHLATVASISREQRAVTLAFDGPKVPVILGHFAAIDLLFPDLNPIPANGKTIEGDKAMAAAAREIVAFAASLRPRATLPARPTWTSETLRAVHAAIVNRGLDRDTLLAGISTSLCASIPRMSKPSDQIMRDLMMLKDVHMSDGSTPLREYIANAAHLARGQREEVVLREAMAALG